jgi:AcrR family transcriptional regulator
LESKRKESEGVRGRPFTVSSAGGSLAQQRLAREAQIRESLQRSALLISGEHGYSSLSVQAMLEMTGVSRTRFYSLFPNKEACYLSAYAGAGERLATDLLTAGQSGGDWVAGMRGGLRRLAEFLAAEPMIARGMISEAIVAGPATIAKRTEILERLGGAIDHARMEAPPSVQSPPPLTASFILHAIESAAIQALFTGRPEEFASSIPDLLFLAVSLYFGSERANAAYRQCKREANEQ